MSQMMPPQGGSPIPPQLLALLAAAHAQGGGDAPAAGPPSDEPDAGGSSERQPIALLKQMIQLGNQYIGVEPDAEDKATMAKLLATLHQYLAKDQQDAEAALGGGPATRTLRKLA